MEVTVPPEPDSTAQPTPQALSPDAVAAFVRDGFVRIPAAFSAETAAQCRDELWRGLRRECPDLDPDDPSSWTRPVIRLPGYGSEPFQRAATAPKLHAAFDQLVGAGRWFPREGLGTFPIRFPRPEEPGDTGWHMDGSFAPEGTTTEAAAKEGYWLNLRSRGRALLMLFLFSEVREQDAPTLIKVGSHLDVPAFLEPLGDRGTSGFGICRAMDAAGRLNAADRPTALATGAPGDVYLCHPFLIHAAQKNLTGQPRFLAQPPLMPTGLLEPERADGGYSPVEQAVRLGLGPMPRSLV
jgi:hypothetical protein